MVLWWSLETWSRSRDVSRDPFFRVSVSKVSGLVSVSKEFGLERETSLETLHELFFMKSCKKRLLKNEFTKQLFKIQPFKTISG